MPTPIEHLAALRPAHPTAHAGLLLAGLLMAAPGSALAQLTDVSGISAIYDKVLSIQPIQVCDTTGTLCPSLPIYPDTLLRTLARAGIATVLLPTNTVYATGLHDARSINPFISARRGISSNWGTLNAWFVPNLVADPGEVLYGLGMVGGNGLAINSNAVSQARRASTFAHEVGHNLGLDHDNLGAGGADNLMTDGTHRNPSAAQLTSDQVARMRSSPFLEAAPQVNVDFDLLPGELTTVTITFVSAPVGVRLRNLSLDLPDFQGGSPGQTPASFYATTGLVSGTAMDATIRYTENMQTYYTRDGEGDQWTSTYGAPELTIDFGVDGLQEGGTLTFQMGVQGNLRNEYTYNIERDLFGADAEFVYDFGLSATVAMMDADSTTDSRALRALGPSVANPAAFGRQLLPGEYGPLGPVDLDPVAAAVPEPTTTTLALLGGLGLAGWCRRRDAQSRPCLRTTI